MKRQYQPSKIRRKRQHGFLAPQLEQERARHSAQSPPRRAQAPDPGIRGRPMAAQTPQRLRFGRAARIKQGRDFARVRQAGERLAVGCLIANWQRLPADSRLAPGRDYRAQDRRRRGAQPRAAAPARDVSALHQHDLAAPVDLVLVARPSIAGQRLRRGGAGFSDHAAESEIVEASRRSESQ